MPAKKTQSGQGLDKSEISGFVDLFCLDKSGWPCYVKKPVDDYCAAQPADPVQQHVPPGV